MLATKFPMTPMHTQKIKGTLKTVAFLRCKLPEGRNQSVQILGDRITYGLKTRVHVWKSCPRHNGQ